MSGNTNEAPSLGSASVEIVPDLRKLRSFAMDLVNLIDRYYPGSADTSERDGSAGSPKEFTVRTGRIR